MSLKSIEKILHLGQAELVKPTDQHELPYMPLSSDKDVREFFTKQSNDPKPRARAIKKFEQLLDTGTNEELLGIFSSRVIGPQEWRRNIGEQTWVKLQKRLEKHAIELDGRWSHLMDGLSTNFSEAWVTLNKKNNYHERTRARWGAWAEALDDHETFDKQVNAAFQYRNKDFVVIVAEHSPIITANFILNVFQGRLLQEVGSKLWKRSDIPHDLFKDGIRDNMEAWHKSGIPPHWVELALKKPSRQWDTFNLELLASAAQAIQRGRRDDKERVAQMVKKIKGSNDAALGEALIQSPIQSILSGLIKRMSATRVRAILEAGANSEIREMVASDQKLIKDP